MKQVCGLSRLGLAGVALVAAFLMMEGEAMAVTLNVCVPEEEGVAIQTPLKGECKAKYNQSRLLPLTEAEKLEKILPYIKYEEKGVDGKPTIKFEGVNVQINNGEGKTATANGEGKLVIGYDETSEKSEKQEQTGSHNLILGAYQTYTSYGGILAGFRNTISGPFASVIGGTENTANHEYSSISGGYRNTASNFASSVSGGYENFAKEFASSVSGGGSNIASGSYSSVSGGKANTASGSYSSVSGGRSNTAKGKYAWVGGGYKNLAEGEFSAVFGGKENTATKEYEAIP